MAITKLIRFQFRRGTAAEWTAANPVLLDGEPGIESDTGALKYGDGATAWNDLDYSGAIAFADITGSPYDNTALAAILSDITGTQATHSSDIATLQSQMASVMGGMTSHSATLIDHEARITALENP